MIYLDYAATTPILDKALDTYNRVSKTYFGNSSSLHDLGTRAAALLALCREELASIIKGETRGIYFTSGGSESNYLALRSLAYGNKQRGKHLITTQIEHSSVKNTMKSLEKEGYQVTYIPPNSAGLIELETLQKAIQKDTILVSICHANSELGIVQPLEEIGQFLHEQEVIFHSDCVQSFGKIEIDLEKTRLDSLSISSHKVYGPKGVGASYISPRIHWQSPIPNSTHEYGFRAGTVNVPGIAAFITATQEVMTSITKESQRSQTLSKKLVAGIRSFFPELIVEGDARERLPHHLGLRFPGIEGQYLLLELNRLGVAISSGTACQVGQQNPSPTLLAMGRSKQEALELIRITLGRFTTATEIDKVTQAIHQVVQEYFLCTS